MGEKIIKHLTLADRSQIEASIKNGASQTAIAKCLGKNKTCVGKEIMKHREKRNGTYPIECSFFPKCSNKKECPGLKCKDFELFKCRRRDHSPGACNGCSTFRSCHYYKWLYNAIEADREYREDLVGTRQGVNMTTGEVIELGNKLKPLIDNGLSPYSASMTCPEIDVSLKSIYNYIEDGVFKSLGVNITDLDLRRKVSRKPRKKKGDNLCKKRTERAYLKGRLYSDYQSYMEIYPDTHVVEMDTVYNDEQNGPFIQTFKFMDGHFLFCLLHKTKTAADMTDGVHLLEKILGEELFEREVQVLLTDRGSEFSNADGMERRENGKLRTRVFYCDAMHSNQKGSLENNHIELRYILPKETDLYELGLRSQEVLNIVVSHINSFPKLLLKGKSSIACLRFYYPELCEAFEKFGISEIPADKVVLLPELLNPFRIDAHQDEE
jgi:IS30 family transposase